MSENMSNPASRWSVPTPREPGDVTEAARETASMKGDTAHGGSRPWSQRPAQAQVGSDGAPASPAQADRVAPTAPKAPRTYSAPGTSIPRPIATTPADAAAPQIPAPWAATSSARPDSPRPAAYSTPTGAPVDQSEAPRATFGASAAQAAPVGPSEAPAPERTRTKRGPGWGAMLLAMLVTGGLSVASAWAIFTTVPTPVRLPPTPASQSATTVQPVSTTGTSPDWQAVAKAVSPAVTTISVQAGDSSGVGSGVVYDDKGDIVTNYHVISSAIGTDGKITATLADGRIFEAEIVGHDRTTDLAVIRLKQAPSDLTVASFGSSQDLAVGQQVMAVGAPLGLSNTATTGIISALNRPVEVSPDDKDQQGQENPEDPFNQLPGQQSQQGAAPSESIITNAIQVDASINPGNSGGPLFDATGKVIGINSSIASNSSAQDQAGSIGLGFAIPADLVTSVVDQLIATGKAEHAVLGVSVKTGGASVDGTTVAGAEVVEVPRGGAAEAAGIQKGDVILAVNGEKVSSSKQLTGYIRHYKGGDQVAIDYVRDGAKYEVVATLQAKQS